MVSYSELFSSNNILNLNENSFKKFSHVIQLPKVYDVYDFTESYDESRELENLYGIGRFNEVRQNMYKGELYNEADKQNYRNIHMGIDIGCPVGEPVFSFADSVIVGFKNNSMPYDYGPTLILESHINNIKVYALYGHLSKSSLEGKSVGQSFTKGQKIASVGLKTENGGWNPHLHFQLSVNRPLEVDMPGVVSLKEREAALKMYIDPRAVLGPLY